MVWTSGGSKSSLTTTLLFSLPSHTRNLPNCATIAVGRGNEIPLPTKKNDHSYVRVKRKNQTFFVHTSPSDTFGRIKSEISLAMGGEDVIVPESMRLYIEAQIEPTTAANKDKKDDDEVVGSKSSMPKGPIPDTAVLSDHNVKNDAVMYVTFAEGKVWEEIDVFKP
jgi:hypothetical protein